MNGTGLPTTDWPGLVERLRPFVARRIRDQGDAEDVLQEALARIHRGLPGISDPGRFEAWTWRIARNAIVDHHRLRGSRAVPVPEPGVDLPAPVVEEDDDQVARALARFLPLFVALLPETYREAVLLVELQGLTHREAAGRLGISVSGVKSRVQRGRRRLREMLEACCELAKDARGKVTDCRVRPETLERPEGCCPGTLNLAGPASCDASTGGKR